jgi:hypothetical protein
MMPAKPLPLWSEDRSTPTDIEDWLVEIKITHDLCVGQYDDLVKAVKSRQGATE